MRLTHVGGPTLLVELGGWRILTDPTFDPPGRKYSFGLGTSSRKVEGPAIAAADLGALDAVLLRHEHHADNLDTAGRAVLATAPIVITTESGAGRLGDHARGLAPWGATRLEAPGRPSVDIVATPCRHGPPLSRPLVGDVVGFAVSIEGESDVLWISGDTVLYDGLREVCRRLDVGVAVLHLGGVQFPVSGPLRYTMTIAQAVSLCRDLRPHTVIPVHYEGWSHFREGRDAIERDLAGAPAEVREAFRFLPIGEGVEIPG